jgi:hypothetical protein
MLTELLKKIFREAQAAHQKRNDTSGGVGVDAQHLNKKKIPFFEKKKCFKWMMIWLLW